MIKEDELDTLWCLGMFETIYFTGHDYIDSNATTFRVKFILNKVSRFEE